MDALGLELAQLRTDFSPLTRTLTSMAGNARTEACAMVRGGADKARVQAGRTAEVVRAQAGKTAEMVRTQAGKAAEVARVQAGKATEMVREQAGKAAGQVSTSIEKRPFASVLVTLAAGMLMGVAFSRTR